jgi:hypothetical protein
MGNITVGAGAEPGPKIEEIPMQCRTALFAAAILAALPAQAQISPAGPAQKPPVQHQPGVPAKPQPSAQPAPAATAAPAAIPEERLDPAKEAAIRHLMDITETSKLGDNMSAFIISQVRSVMTRTIQPDNLQKFMDIFSQKFGASAPPNAITNAMVPIYARAFSIEDIQGLVSFYESPLGRRVVKALPEVIQESQNAGAEIDRKVALDVLRGMSADYPELKQILPPDNAQPEPAPAAGAAPDKTPAPATGAAPEKVPAAGAAPAPKPSPAPSQK